MKASNRLGLPVVATSVAGLHAHEAAAEFCSKEPHVLRGEVGAQPPSRHSPQRCVTDSVNVPGQCTHLQVERP